MYLNRRKLLGVLAGTGAALPVLGRDRIATASDPSISMDDLFGREPLKPVSVPLDFHPTSFVLENPPRFGLSLGHTAVGVDWFEALVLGDLSPKASAVELSVAQRFQPAATMNWERVLGRAEAQPWHRLPGGLLFTCQFPLPALAQTTELRFLVHLFDQDGWPYEIHAPRVLGAGRIEELSLPQWHFQGPGKGYTGPIPADSTLTVKGGIVVGHR